MARELLERERSLALLSAATTVEVLSETAENLPPASCVPGKRGTCAVTVLTRAGLFQI